MEVTVIGAGLAGSECAWQLAQRGIDVILREMKPEKKTPAHTTDQFAELWLLQFSAQRPAGKRGGPFERGAAPDGFPDSLLCGCNPGGSRPGPWRWSRHGFAALVTERDPESSPDPGRSR